MDYRNGVKLRRMRNHVAFTAATAVTTTTVVLCNNNPTVSHPISVQASINFILVGRIKFRKLITYTNMFNLIKVRVLNSNILEYISLFLVAIFYCLVHNST